MQVRALALDYDGTIAESGYLEPSVREAITDARAHGIVVLLVTGRQLRDLRQIVGDLRLFDAVVAENGALVHFPASNRTILRGHPPPAGFAQTLLQHGISLSSGQCVIEASARDAPRILAEIHAQALPLVLIFNRQSVMVLAEGITKSAGLATALEILRVSPHNTVGIGDAENDHSLLEACEIGVAVGWGSPALRAAADEVLPGSGPSAVAGYIHTLVDQPSIAPERAGYRHVVLGNDCHGQPFDLAIRGRNVLVVGDPRSGKSWLAGLLAEQLILMGYCVCILDPEGDYATLRSLPRVVVLGGEDPPPQPHEVWRAMRGPDTSVVVDLSHLSLDEKREQVAALIPLLTSLRRETGFPHRVLLDEAHYFLAEPEIHTQLELELGGYILVTYRVDQFPSDVLATSEVVLATRVTDEREIATLPSLPGVDRSELARELSNLALDEAIVMPNVQESGGALQHLELAPRLTLHVRHRQKYLDVPVLARHAFVFTRAGAVTGERAATLADFVRIVRSGPPDILAGHLRRGDISRWVREVFGDQPLAQQLAAIERGYRSGSRTDACRAVLRCIMQRYASEAD